MYNLLNFLFILILVLLFVFADEMADYRSVLRFIGVAYLVFVIYIMFFEYWFSKNREKFRICCCLWKTTKTRIRIRWLSNDARLMIKVACVLCIVIIYNQLHIGKRLIFPQLFKCLFKSSFHIICERIEIYD